MENSTKYLLFFVLIILLFYLLKFFGIGLVGVASGSMEHNDPDGFKEFWLNQDLNENEITNLSFSNGINTGDALLYYSTKNLKKGDPGIFYETNCPDDSTQIRLCKLTSRMIVHRFVEMNQTHYFFRSDNTQGATNLSRYAYTDVAKKQYVVGKAFLRIPKLGWLHLKVSCFLRSIIGLRCN